mgnify:CR=1 FL=1
MERLTIEEIKKRKEAILAITGKNPTSSIARVDTLDELLEYKQLEKELGIDLITLFKTDKCLIEQEISYEHANNKNTVIKLFGWGKRTLKSQVNYYLKLTKEELGE